MFGKMGRYALLALVLLVCFGWFGFRVYSSQVHTQNVEQYIPFSIGQQPHELWGLRDIDGNIVIPAKYDFVGPSINGLVSVMVRDSSYDIWDRDLWGLYDIAGHKVVPVEFAADEISLIRDLVNMPERLMPAEVEQLHWTEVRELLPLRVPIRITDIGTGIYYYVLSMSNGNHADVETVTAHDTTLLNETFGWVNTWAGRPVWVTIGEHTFSASIHNMPHAQSTVSGNNMNGHLCLHFYGSTSHNTNRPTYHNVIIGAQNAFDLLNRVINDFIDSGIVSTQVLTASVVANSSNVIVFVDGVMVDLTVYNIGGHNYFRLRDLAYALSGSSVQFNLFWNAVHQAIFILPDMPYEPIGNEMRVDYYESTRAVPTNAAIFINSSEVNVSAYTIDGSNFFRLVDVADLLRFSVDWNETARAIIIRTY